MEDLGISLNSPESEQFDDSFETEDYEYFQPITPDSFEIEDKSLKENQEGQSILKDLLKRLGIQNEFEIIDQQQGKFKKIEPTDQKGVSILKEVKNILGGQIVERETFEYETIKSLDRISVEKSNQNKYQHNKKLSNSNDYQLMKSTMDWSYEIDDSKPKTVSEMIVFFENLFKRGRDHLRSW